MKRYAGELKNRVWSFITEILNSYKENPLPKLWAEDFLSDGFDIFQHALTEIKAIIKGKEGEKFIIIRKSTSIDCFSLLE